MSLIRTRVAVSALLASTVAAAAVGVVVLAHFDDRAQLAALVPAALGLVVALTGLVEFRALRMAQQSFTTALNNISHGLCMFDTAGRLVLCNERYLEMYKLSPAIVKPGCTLRELLAHRQAVGMFVGDIEAYIADRGVENEAKKKSIVTMELPDGRIVTTVSQPLKHGGWVATHEDVTELRHREQELARTRTFLNTVIDNVPAAISVKNADDLRYVLINRAGEDIYGLSRDEMIGKTVHELFPGRSMDTIEIRDRSALQAGTVQSAPDQVYMSPTKGRRIHTSRRVPVLDEAGNPLYLLLVIQDITEQREAERRAEHLARYDALTDLPNRAAFNQHLTEAIARNSAANTDLAVMCINFDHFKDINDVYSSAVGDEVLKMVAERLTDAALGQFAARLSGDEFALVIENVPQPEGAAAIGDRLLAAMGTDFEIQGYSLRPGMSIGVAVCPNDGSDQESLLANANAALYRAKMSGRGSMRFFEAKMDDQLRERRALTQDLRSAVERKELTLYYQPQAHIDGEIIGFEALARWHHPTLGLVGPDTFIPLAEESGLIVELGEWILREACREAASWPKPLRIAINLSAAQFRHGDLVGLVHAVLLETGLAAARLEIEITESMLADDFSRAASILRRLKALGLHIAMDDFGTGYSSLQNLQSLAFDKLKIDRSFISNLETNQHSATIVRAVIGLSRGFGLPTVAEGVETAGQLAFLAAESCDEVQGFLIGRPQPIEAYADIVGREPGNAMTPVPRAVA